MLANVTIDPTKIDLMPENELAEIMQNVRTIVLTRVGTVPLDRAFGLKFDALDQPIGIAKTRFIVDVVDAVQKFEPRARVVTINWRADSTDALDGILAPTITLEVDLS